MSNQSTTRSYPSNIAVIGAGYWGINHVRNFYELGALNLVCDPDETMLGKVRTRYGGVRTLTDVGKVFADPSIKAIVLATPAETHGELATRAIEAGKDVLVEKPLTLDVEQGRRLVQFADERGAILMVGHLLEYHPAVLRLRELIRSGELGELRYVYSNRLNLGKVRREENILWSFAPHDIAIILRLVDAWPACVTATGGCYLRPQIADVTVTTIEFPNGVRAHIFVSWLHPYKEQRLVVVGSKRMAVFDDVREDSKLIIYDQGVEIIDDEPVTRKNEGIAELIESEEPLRRQCVQFLESVRTRQRPLTDGESGVRVLRVLDAAEKSLAEGGKPVSL